MIIAVIAVDVVQVTVDHVVDVVTVWDRFVPTPRPVNVPRLVSAALMSRRAVIRVDLGYSDHVLIDVVTVRMMQVPVVQVIDVSVVLNGLMATTRTVDVIVLLVLRAFGHDVLLGGASAAALPRRDRRCW